MLHHKYEKTRKKRKNKVGYKGVKISIALSLLINQTCNNIFSYKS